jgi:hypothetical protein
MRFYDRALLACPVSKDGTRCRVSAATGPSGRFAGTSEVVRGSMVPVTTTPLAASPFPRARYPLGAPVRPRYAMRLLPESTIEAFVGRFRPMP